MSQHMRILAAASLGLVLAACTERSSTTAPIADATASEALALESAQASAERAGDTESATAFRSAAAALRFGIRPTSLVVSVDGETTRYLAVVTATVQVLASRDTALRRTLVAWHNVEGRPGAVLQIETLGDQGSFSSTDEPASDPRSRATGLWVDLLRPSRWIATAGEAMLGVASTGGDCAPIGRSDAAVRCVRAEFRVGVDGLFRLHGGAPDDGGPAVRILSEPQLVNGAILARVGGSGTR